MARSEDDTRAERLAKCLAQIGMSEGCPSCGHHRWEYPRQTAVLLHPEEGRHGAGAEVVMVMCSNCFYLQFHSAHHLEKFLGGG